MKVYELQQYGLVSAFFAFGAISGLVAPSEAAVVSYQFQVPVISVNSPPSNLTGTVSFDSALLTNSGNETLSVNNGITTAFSFLGTDYTQADDPGASLSFFNGQLLGLDFLVSGPPIEFVFSSAIPNATEPQFVYQTSTDIGSGLVQYTLIPEPSALAGLGALGVLGIAALAKRRF